MVEVLSSLFYKYKTILNDSTLLPLLNKNFVYSQLPPTANFLIVGFNPSSRQNYLQNENSYHFETLAKDRYFKKFYSLFEKEVDMQEVAYLDLFYQVHSEQKMIERFYSSAFGLAFLQEQLDLTKQRIVALKPQVIFVFNREARLFFNQHPKYKIGMNFSLKSIDDHQIAKIETGHLKGTFIFFSRFLNHFVSLEEMNSIQRSVSQLIKQTI